jgi:hypothetical protein
LGCRSPAYCCPANVASPLTDVKLLAVLTVAINGVHVGRLQLAMASYVDGVWPPRSVMRGSSVAVMVSQCAWWTATTTSIMM